MSNTKEVAQLRRGRMAVGAIGIVLAGGYLIVALNMPLGTPKGPGPGVFPIGVGVAGIVISLLVVGEAFLRQHEEGGIELPRGQQAKHVLVFLGATAAYILLLPLFGQYLLSTLYMATLIAYLGRLPWWKVGIYSLIGGAGVSWLFAEVFGVLLPGGVF